MSYEQIGTRLDITIRQGVDTGKIRCTATTDAGDVYSLEGITPSGGVYRNSDRVKLADIEFDTSLAADGIMDFWLTPADQESLGTSDIDMTPLYSYKINLTMTNDMIFLSFLAITANGTIEIGNINQSCYSSISVDGTGVDVYMAGASYAGGASLPLGQMYFTQSLAEGYHYATIIGKVSAGGITYSGGATPGDRTTLQVRVADRK